MLEELQLRIKLFLQRLEENSRKLNRDIQREQNESSRLDQVNQKLDLQLKNKKKREEIEEKRKQLG